MIVDVGIDCAATAIFDTGNTDVCTLGANGGFAFIAIGNATGLTSTTPVSRATDTGLLSTGGGVGSFGTGGGDEITRSGFVDATITAADTAGTGADTTVSIASPAFTFADLGPTGTSITQSGLFDGAAAGNMFSIRDIPGQSGTGLAVTNADTLSVTWTITLQ